MIVSICSCSCVHVGTFVCQSLLVKGGVWLVKCHRCDDGGAGECGLTPSEVEM